MDDDKLCCMLLRGCCVMLRGAAWCCVMLRVCCVGAAWVLRGCCMGAACVLRVGMNVSRDDRKGNIFI